MGLIEDTPTPQQVHRYEVALARSIKRMHEGEASIAEGINTTAKVWPDEYAGFIAWLRQTIDCAYIDESISLPRIIYMCGVLRLLVKRRDSGEPLTPEEVRKTLAA